MYLLKLVYNSNINNNVNTKEIFKVHDDLINFLNHCFNSSYKISNVS